MGRTIYYNILRDGDNTLKGLIAEMVFERVAHHLIGSPQLQCCTTLELAHLLSLTRDASKFPSHRVHLNLDLETIISRYSAEGTLENELAETLKSLRLYAGLSEEDIDPEAAIHNSLYRCPLCLRSREMLHGERFITLDISGCRLYSNYTLFISLCSTCYEYLTKKGYIIFGELKSEELERLFCTLKPLLELYRYRDVIRILARLDKEDREMLLNIYAQPGSGNHPFDYLCVDEKGGKYLVDVASTAGHHSASPLSKREKKS